MSMLLLLTLGAILGFNLVVVGVLIAMYLKETRLQALSTVTEPARIPGSHRQRRGLAAAASR